MLNTENESSYYIGEIVVECSEEDAGRLELEGLKLVLFDETNHWVDLTRVSRTTWRQKDDDKIQVPAEAFLLVATTDSFGDVCYVHINLGETPRGRIGPNSARIRTGLIMQPILPGVEMSLSMEMYDSAEDTTENKGPEGDAVAFDPFELLDRAQLLSDTDPMKVDILNALGSEFFQRFKTTGKEEQIDAGIKANEQAVALLAGDDSRLAGFLNDIGSAYYHRHKKFGRPGDIDKAIKNWQIARAMMAENDGSLPVLLNNLGILYAKRFETTGALSDISEAIQLQQQAVDVTPEGHPDLQSRLNTLGACFLRRFEQSGQLADISEAIRLQQLAANLTPEGHAVLLASQLNHLGHYLSQRFERFGELADLSEAIRLRQEAVLLTPLGHSDLPSWLNNLGISLLCRFERSGDVADVSEAIRLQQEAVKLISERHVDLPSLLSNLGGSLTRRFERAGQLTDISEAIHVQQRAVQLTPKGHPNLPSRLDNLGISLLCRFERSGELVDISESIRLQQQAVNLTPEGHHELPSLLSNLGSSLTRRFEKLGEVADISEAIQIRQQVVKLAPEGHPLLPLWLTGLGNCFRRRFERLGELADIYEATRLQQRAVDLTPEGHSDLPSLLSNLGASLTCQFEWDGQLANISEAINVHQRAVQLAPEGHSGLPSWLDNLGKSFLHRFERFREPEDLFGAISNFKTSALSVTGSPSVCMNAAKKWADLSSPFSSSEGVNAHRRIMELLSILTGFENTLERRHQLLLDTSRLSTTAAAAAISARQFATALEWLEEGRCIVWHQINQLRTPVDELRRHNAALADQLIDLSKRLEYAGDRRDPRRPDIDLPLDMKIQVQTEARDHLMLVQERDKVLETVRQLPGFNNFLRPRKCADLMSRLPADGPVIMINANKEHCDALALVANRDEPMHIPLPEFSYERAAILAQKLRQYLASHGLRTRYSEELETTSNFRAMRRERHDALSEQGIQVLLRALWTDLVEPILQALGMKVERSNTDLPRIWWCPTGPFAFLPLHAAGIYTNEGNTEICCLADFAISSYIPTLSILEKLRSRSPTKGNDGVLLVSQPNTPGLTPISCTSLEVQKARADMEERGVISNLYEGEKATAAVVSDALGSYSCIHLACHASQDAENPLESAIYLHDGPLKLREIMKQDLPYADLAFMSACQTSAGAEKLPEEAVHLAAGMLAVGYRSVIATMWSIADRHAPAIAETFYKNLLSEKTAEGIVKLDVSESARALHIAAQSLRTSQGDTAEGLLAWIPYVHYGI